MVDRDETGGAAPSSASDPTAAYVAGSPADDLVRVLDQYLADLQAGCAPAREQLLADNPTLAPQLASYLSGIEFIHRTTGAHAAPEQLGDFQIIREVGRGGMGVVYEARQCSLNRRVALKVLRFGPVADQQAMERFQREAETVAQLHHTNIVPIFAIGNQQGVYYYAMQFIEGRSLAAVAEGLGDPASCPAPRDYRQIAGWILQGAEALAHAHQRGVIHRDIKPSNLILDPEETVWLTDFGLAKRADEVTLTAAGVLMGTPRYMSPEQAAASQQPIDHRTDIYSLGATLYELVTGKPVFDSPTPHGVITQILHAEPAAPRMLQRSVPRDLETIILKCLAKDAARRYAQARDLADDLRAFLDQRPIRARRATLRERSVRWVRKHRRSTFVAGAAAIASSLLIAGSWFGWQAYRESRLGGLQFTTDGPALVADVLPTAGGPDVPSFPVPNKEPVRVPEGEYPVRFSSPGLLSETWNVDVPRGGPLPQSVKLVQQQCGAPLLVSGTAPPYIIELDGLNHVLFRAERGWRLVRGDTLQPVWPENLVKVLTPEEESQYPRPYASGSGSDLLQAVSAAMYINQTTGDAPGLLNRTIDVDGDGKQDLVFASRVSPSLLAVSGPTGKILWWHRASPPLPPEHDWQHDPLDAKSSYEVAATIGQPQLATVHGEPAVLAIFMSASSQLRTKSGKVFPWKERKYFIEAVAARTGKPLWRADIPLGEWAGKILSEITERFPARPTIRALAGRETVLLHAGRKLFAWDLETGRECWPPHDLGANPIQTAQYGDLDGDGSPEAMLLFFTEPRDTPTLNLQVLRLQSPAILWERTVHSTQEVHEHTWRPAGREQAWLVDLDGDGRSEVLLPLGDDWRLFIKHTVALELLDGATGKERWQSRSRSLVRLSGNMRVPLEALAGPDLTGDGHAEVFAVSTNTSFDPSGGGTRLLQVEAIDGQDGRILWRWRRDIGGQFVQDGDFSVPPWWQADDHGWPQLVVSVAKDSGGQPMSYVLASESGQLCQTLAEVADPAVADIDSDGLPDLWYLSKAQDVRRMTILKGAPPLAWRRPGVWIPAADFDGDGVVDYLEFGPIFAARSGRDGSILWRAVLQFSQSWGGASHPWGVAPWTLADVDQDGTSDLVIMELLIHYHRDKESGLTYGQSRTQLSAFSGKDGHRLWSSNGFDLGSGSSSSTGQTPDQAFALPVMVTRDLDGDGRVEIIVASHFNPNVEAVAAFSSRDGALLWKLPVDQHGLPGSRIFDEMFGDLNGDGVLDLVLWSPSGEKSLSVGGLQAYSGRDGSALWSDAHADGSGLGTCVWKSYPVLGDVDGDGACEVVLVAYENAPGKSLCELIVLDGHTGAVRWSWPWQTDDPYKVWRPVLANLDAGPARCLALGISEMPQRAPQIVVLEPSGEVRRRIPVSTVDMSGFLAARDLDGDGLDELLFHDQARLQAYRERDQAILWKQPAVPNSYRLTPLGNEPVGLQDLLCWQSVDGARMWLERATGAVRWRHESPRLDGQSFHSALVACSGPGEPPLFACVSPHADSTLVRHAWPTEADGRYRSPASKPETYRPFDDPDRAQPLPWATLPPAATTLLLALAVLARTLLWVARACWRWAIAYLLLVPAASLLLALLMLSSARGQLAPDEYYATSGWYWILVPGVSVIGFLTVVGTLAVWSWRYVLRAGWRRLAALFRSRAAHGS